MNKNSPEELATKAQSDRFLEALRTTTPPHNAYVPAGAKQ